MFGIIALVACYWYRLLKCLPPQRSRSAYYNNDDRDLGSLVKDDLLHHQPLRWYDIDPPDSYCSSGWTSGFGGTTRR
ncbi:hypothetical protein OS493_034087 [Desmophyllum pertusum]|uniref:Secreted protein n=1 Tax=Desmophyllum pertusum TaxID=174260 RepID=A0A9W9YIX4_9CNID|nr:hypothetical protein OS493_034087 [Desmophyllum pertusum]